MAGSPVARRLVREVDTEPDGLRRVDVIGPGGHGKTVLLDALAAAFGSAGIAGPPGPARTGEELGRGRRAPGRRRPPAAAGRAGRGWPAGRRARAATWWWPTGPGRARPAPPRSGAALAAHRPPVVLDVLDRTGVAARASAAAGPSRPAAGLASWSSWCSSGPPGCRCWSTGCSTRWWSRPGRTGPGCRCPTESPPGPAGAARLHGARPRSRACGGLLLARALGAPLEAEVLVPLLGLTGGPRRQLDELLEAARAAGLLTARRAGHPARLRRGAGPHPGRRPGRSCGARWPRSSSTAAATCAPRPAACSARARAAPGRPRCSRAAAEEALRTGGAGGGRVPRRRGAGRDARRWSWPPAGPRPPCSPATSTSRSPRPTRCSSAPDQVPPADAGPGRHGGRRRAGPARHAGPQRRALPLDGRASTGLAPRPCSRCPR